MSEALARADEMLVDVKAKSFTRDTRVRSQELETNSAHQRHPAHVDQLEPIPRARADSR